MAAALPHLRTLRTVISCRRDTGGDGHRRIMAEHGLAAAPRGRDTAQSHLDTVTLERGVKQSSRYFGRSGEGATLEQRAPLGRRAAKRGSGVGAAGTAPDAVRRVGFSRVGSSGTPVWVGEGIQHGSQLDAYAGTVCAATVGPIRAGLRSRTRRRGRPGAQRTRGLARTSVRDSDCGGVGCRDN